MCTLYRNRINTTSHTTTTLQVDRDKVYLLEQCGLYLLICYALHQLHVPNKEKKPKCLHAVDHPMEDAPSLLLGRLIRS